MKVVYIFNESGFFRIPFFSSHDSCLFHLLAGRGGVFDKTRQQFIFQKGTSPYNLWMKRPENKSHNAYQQLSRFIPGFPCVCVSAVSTVPEISGFFGRPWDSAIYIPPRVLPRALPGKRPPASVMKYTMLGPLPLPEKFPEQWRARLEDELRSRKYSPNTLRAYVYYNRLLCKTLQKLPEEINNEDITWFLAHVEKNRDYSSSAMNLAISAIKFFYDKVMKTVIADKHQRPRHDKRLPPVLSKEEVSKMFSLEKNPKHRLLLMLVYSSGLRVSEVVVLKKEHIDFSRKVIYIRRGKGRKDRCTLLSDKAARFIIEYCSFFGIENWLFPGQPPTRHLTIRSAQHIFDKAVRCASITKDISIHSLRHTFATHLLESGTDIRYIQTLLGHTNLRTTERYTHIARRNILSIQSPLDSLI